MGGETDGSGKTKDGATMGTGENGMDGVGLRRGWVVPGVVGAIEEFLDNLLGGDDVDLVDVVDGGPRGDGEGG